MMCITPHWLKCLHAPVTPILIPSMVSGLVVFSSLLCSSLCSFPCVSPSPCSSLPTSTCALSWTSSSMWTTPRKTLLAPPPIEESCSLAEFTPPTWGVLLRGDTKPSHTHSCTRKRVCSSSKRCFLRPCWPLMWVTKSLKSYWCRFIRKCWMMSRGRCLLVLQHSKIQALPIESWWNSTVWQTFGVTLGARCASNLEDVIHRIENKRKWT